MPLGYKKAFTGTSRVEDCLTQQLRLVPWSLRVLSGIGILQSCLERNWSPAAGYVTKGWRFQPK